MLIVRIRRLSCLWSTAIDYTVIETGKTDAFLSSQNNPYFQWKFSSLYLHYNLGNCCRLIKRFQLTNRQTDMAVNAPDKVRWQVWWKQIGRETLTTSTMFHSFLLFSLSANNLKMAIAIKLLLCWWRGELGLAKQTNSHTGLHDKARMDWESNSRKERKRRGNGTRTIFSLTATTFYGTVDETDKIKGSTSEQIRLLRKTKRSMTAQADADGPVGMLPGKAMHCQQQQQ